MGYTHYWYRKARYGSRDMEALVQDFQNLIGPMREQGIVLAESFESDAEPELSPDLIQFNGRGPAGHEDLYFPQELDQRDLDRKRPGKSEPYFQFCKTAHKPYDLAVTAFLVIAKHHLREGLKVRSDGTEEEWLPARTLCQKALGYGQDFRLDPE